jgi:uncharacterized protein YacL
MTIWVIRAFFLLVSAGTGALIAKFKPAGVLTEWDWIVGMIGLYLVVMALEMLLGAASDISVLVLGLIVGVILSFLSHSLIMLAFPEAGEADKDYSLAIRLILICVFCYLSVVLVYKTRHRFSFIIPYVEFHRQQKGPRALVVDTSAIIDGRIADICETSVFDTPIVIPRFILRELQGIADSADRLKRARGRRGLDIVNRLQQSSTVEVVIEESEVPGSDSVYSKLVRLAGSLGARIITNDFNLNKVAQIQGVNVLNINDLANALRPALIPGDKFQIELVKEGSEPGQGIGYLEDGTMVVAENGLSYVGSIVDLEVTRTLQTSAGKMIFGRVGGKESPRGPRPGGRRPR